MDPITMMVASIGMQFFNNYANNEKNDEIQAQQREFQIAAAEHDFERMRKAQAAAAKLALELEAEVHKERVEDIEKGYDTLLDNFANSFAITDWPLNVLPFIMKGESFGTLFGGTAKSISMHCILTPSNCAWFNEYFYDDLDFRVEAEMNNIWNAQSTHPVVYYGGGWNRRQNNLNGGTAPSLIDLDDIALLKNKLKQIPTMIITPYFDPYLHFRVQLWGMGKDANTPFRIDVPQGEIASSSRIFSYDYKKENNTPELTDDFFNTTMEELVPYLTCLIGFIADKYFWSMYGMAPLLPKLVQTNWQFKLLKDRIHTKYSQLLKSSFKQNNEKTFNDAFIRKESLMSLYKGTKPIIDYHEQSQFIISLLNRTTGGLGVSINSIERCKNLDGYFTTEDLPFLRDLIAEMHDEQIKEKLSDVYDIIKSQIVCSTIEYESLTILEILEHAQDVLENNYNKEVIVEIHENFVLIALLADDGETFINDSENPKCLILQYKKGLEESARQTQDLHPKGSRT